MNARFPVESGESLTKNVAMAQQQQQKGRDEMHLPVWVYVIFRKNPSSGHEKVSIKDRPPRPSKLLRSGDGSRQPQKMSPKMSEFRPNPGFASEIAQNCLLFV
uniref:Uncharacterized protein n=1 Tax=Globodera pallida TaxID=36090 RepID=A0A183CLW1_GLOPA